MLHALQGSHAIMDAASKQSSSVQMWTDSPVLNNNALLLPQGQADRPRARSKPPAVIDQRTGEHFNSKSARQRAEAQWELNELQ